MLTQNFAALFHFVHLLWLWHTWLLFAWGVLVDSWIACAVMRMLVRMTVFKTSDYLFLFRELPRKRRTKVVNKNKVLIMNNQNFINLLHKTVSPSQNSWKVSSLTSTGLGNYHRVSWLHILYQSHDRQLAHSHCQYPHFNCLFTHDCTLVSMTWSTIMRLWFSETPLLYHKIVLIRIV